MKFLVYGADGWIGGYIKDTIVKAGDTVVTGSRVTTLSDVKADVARHQPDRVICSVGRTYGPGFMTIDYLEQPGKLLENLTANLTAPVLIAQAAAPIATLYIGSGCIFEYDEKHPQGGKGFTEDEYPNFFGSSYSVAKGQTDTVMRGFPNVICARIRMPIADEHHPRDFITKIVGYKKICSIPNSMTILSDWLPFLIGCLVEKKAGMINATNPGVMEHKVILTMYEDATKRKHPYELMTIDDQNKMLLAGRSNNYLETDKAEKWWGELAEETRAKYGVPQTLEPIEARVKKVLEHRAALEAKSQPKVFLVTGGAGFIGSNFINYWMQKHPDDTIVNFDCLEPHSNLKNIQDETNKNYKFVHGNLVDRICMAKLFLAFDFTHIVHFAAASNVDLSFVSPLNCTISNVLGTHVLIEELRQCRSLKLFVYISTDEVYGEMPNNKEAREQDTIFCPTNPYAATKAAAECLVMAYGKSYGLPWIITRANNVYGRYQYPAQAIPKFITCLLNRQKMPIHGTGKMTRKFLHVLDKCRAIETLLDKGVIGEFYNIGAVEEFSVLELAAGIMEKILGVDAHLVDWTTHVPDRCYNDCRYSVDSTKLENLGWQPEIAFEEGLLDTVQWYTNNSSHWDHKDVQGNKDKKVQLASSTGGAYAYLKPAFTATDVQEDDETLLPTVWAEVIYT